MDSLVNAAARALAAGDPIGALNRVALREDAPSLALRGVAMAQLGDLEAAKALLKRAGRAFGPKASMARARCVVAEAEIALVSRDLGWPEKSLETARKALEAHGDRLNAAHARHLQARRLLLVGRLEETESALGLLDPAPLPPALRTVHELVVAGVAMRRLRTKPAREALFRAEHAAQAARIAGLLAEVEQAKVALDAPAARLIARDGEKPLTLADVGALQATDALIVDACRNHVRQSGQKVPLATRPVLFALVRTLAEVWPGDASRTTLLSRAFGAKFTDESHRARLRVEIGRLRAEIKPLADIEATKDGFVLRPRGEVVVLARPVEEKNASVLAFLADGEAWSSSALALALDLSQRTVQRALDELAEGGKVQSFGRGRAKRWTTPPLAGFTTTLLLPGPL